jgi:hypothetical protein
MACCERLIGTLSEPDSLTGVLTIPRVIAPDAYEGDYVITPGEEAQTMETNGKMMLGNVTIRPVPASYGRLEYNGQCLRVY